MNIRKCPETMTGRERVRATFAFEKTDRPPISYEANPVIHGKFAQALGAGSMEDVFLAIGADSRRLNARYTGPRIFPPSPEGRKRNPFEGYITRWVENASGGYWDYCDFPLADAEDEAFYNFPVPDPDCYDYEEMKALAKSYNGQYALWVGGAGQPDVINSNGRIMGMENILCHLLTGYEPAMDLINRRAKWSLGVAERTIAACKGEVDYLFLGEDLGTQRGPMISLDLYRRVIKPIHKMYIDMADSYHIPVMIHTCGSSSWVYEDFIEMGVKGVDTLQPEAVNMSPDYLLAHFGGRLNMRGCISTAGPLAYGTAAEDRENVYQVLEKMKPCGGYHFAPTHLIQDNTPVENVFAMYQAVHDFAAGLPL